MNRALPKQPRLRLDLELYERLRQQVLRRDDWRCQNCGTRSNLEVHHKAFRSQAGDDSDENLITLCVTCHADIHEGTAVCDLYGARRLAQNPNIHQQADGDLLVNQRCG